MKRSMIALALTAVMLYTLAGAAFSAPRKQEYRHVVALGADRSWSEGDDSLGPIIAYYYFKEDFTNPNLYAQFTLTTTDTFFKLGWRSDAVDIGVQPMLQHFWYGGYSAYDRGDSDETRRFYGNSAGGIAYLRLSPADVFSTTVAYRGTYHFYADMEDTEIDLPDGHWQNMGSVELALNTVKEKNLGRIKHGLLAKARYEHARRIGYGTFEDTAAVEDSSEDVANKLYFTLGAYYNLPGDFTLLLDVVGGAQYGVDRNNAEKIGYFCADHAVVPGYYAAEFYHDRYAVAGAQIGIPIRPWDTRIQPGYYVLYMPEHNHVVGVQDYPRTAYQGVSLGISTKLGDVLPFFFDYGYGIDADRKGKKGNHEFRVLVVAAFGKNEGVEERN